MARKTKFYMCSILFMVMIFGYVSLQKRSNLERIPVATRRVPKLMNVDALAGLKMVPEVRLLCWVPVSPSVGDSAKQSGFAVRDTWGRLCDRFLFIGTKEDIHLNPLVVQSREGDEFLWGKVREALKIIAEKFGHSYDWFVKADIDTYIVVDNLRDFLLRRSPYDAVAYGLLLKDDNNGTYLHGGTGYALSQGAMLNLLPHLKEQDQITSSNELNAKKAVEHNTKACRTDQRGREDTNLGKCLLTSGVRLSDPRDDHGRCRFIPLPLDRMFDPLSRVKYPWIQHRPVKEIKKGTNCCSNQPISFHRVSPTVMRSLHLLLYNVTVAKKKYHGE